LGVGRSEGLEDYSAGYEIPVNVHDTTVGIDYSFSRSDVVEAPFDPLDIKSTSQTAGLRVRHPWLRDQNTKLELFGNFEWRQSKTYLLGEPFSFVEGPEDGLARLTVLRLGLDYVERDLQQVIAARSMFSVGLPLLGATEHGGTTPDGRFFAWLGQFQWLRRIDRLWGSQALFRTDVQLAASPLLSLEQFAVGGHSTVRGYRENQLVRDNGLVSSLELRIPVISSASGRSSVQLAPFFDIGRSWNSDREEVGTETLYSAGVGLRLQLTEHFEGQFYWGHAFKDFETPEDHDLQDSGIHFQTSISY
jgi:hemolysin activation/secretion protein